MLHTMNASHRMEKHFTKYYIKVCQIHQMTEKWIGQAIMHSAFTAHLVYIRPNFSAQSKF